MQDNLLLLCFGTEFKNHIAEIRHLRFLWGLCVLENNLLDIKLSLGSFHQPPTPAEKLSALEKLVTTSWCRALLKASTFSLPAESTWDVGVAFKRHRSVVQCVINKVQWAPWLIQGAGSGIYERGRGKGSISAVGTVTTHGDCCTCAQPEGPQHKGSGQSLQHSSLRNT